MPILSKQNHKDYFVIFSLAFIIKIIFLYQFQSVIIFNHPIVDMAYHHQWAESIANGKEFYSGPFFRAPLYPLFLGAVYWLFGESAWIIRIIQAVLGSLSCVLLYEIGRTLFVRKVGLTAAVIMALYAPMIFFEAQLLVPAVGIFLNLSALLFVIKSQNDNKVRSYIFAGLFLGLSVITRPTIGLFVLILILFLIYQARKNLAAELKKISLMVLALCIPIAPVTIYNNAQNSEITVVAAYGGINFYIGNYIGADGVSPVIPGVRQDWQGGKDDTKAIAEQEVGHPLTESELSNYWFKKGIDDIVDDPIRWFSLLTKKLLLLSNGLELSNNFDFYFFAHQTMLMKILLQKKYIFFPFALLFPFSLLGILTLSYKERSQKILLLYTIATILSIILFLITARYRIYLIPIFILYASYMVVEILTTWKKQQLSKKLFNAVLLVIFFIVSNSDFYDYSKQSYAHGYHTTATIYKEEGKIAEAESYYKKALEADPNLRETINDYGLMLTNMQRFTEAESLFIHGSQLPNTNYSMNYNLGYLYLISNKLEKAKTEFKKVIEQRPDYLYAHNNLGLSYMWLGQLDSSLIVYRNLIRSYPQFSTSYYNSGLIWIEKNNADSAGYYFKKFLSHPQIDNSQRQTSLYLLDSLGFSPN